MASVADQIYCLPTTVFQLQRKQHRLSWQGFLEKYHIKTVTVKSSENLSGSRLDKITSANTLHYGNKKQTDISERMYKEVRKNRLLLQKIAVNYEDGTKSMPQKVPEPLLGFQAVQKGVVDKLGEHYDILKNKFPKAHFESIKYVEEPRSIRKGMGILTSPILIALFALKVIIKWSLIVYVWLKAKAKEVVVQSAQSKSQDYPTSIE